MSNTIAPTKTSQEAALIDNDDAFREFTPREIVHELDQHIIGQDEAKRAVAIALRSRWRRMQVSDELRREITPKNILMIGPTGVGKTEVARRLAQLVEAPFIKVEATKFTEVGYVGRDVDSIVRDLIEIAIKMVREAEKKKVQKHAEKFAEERILDILLPAPEQKKKAEFERKPEAKSPTREAFRKRLKEGKLDAEEIEIDVASGSFGVEIMAPPGMEEMTSQLQDMLQGLKDRGNTKRRRMSIKSALKYFEEEEALKMVDENKVREQAIRTAEQDGIVFIDEFDKIVRRTDQHGGDVSREGVQRDLLPLIEGSTVSTRYGTVKTDHMLFIASGAFQLAKPSDLIPELQGRLPIRVELNALTASDFERILTEPNASLKEQYVALMATEGLSLVFTKDGIQTIAAIAFQVNEKMENIGARRLYTILERVLETVSFDADKLADEVKRVRINKGYVKERLANLVQDEDLSRYIL